MMTYDEIAPMIKQMSTRDKLRLVQELAYELQNDLEPQEKKPRPNLYGMWAHLGIEVSEEDIAEVRAEMWKNFPHEDI